MAVTLPCHCHALCQISKWLGNWGISYEQVRTCKISISDEPPGAILHDNIPQATHTHTTGAASLLPSGPIVVLFQLLALHVKHVGQVNTLRPGQNGRNFAHNIFKFFLLNENCCILILISLKFVPEGPIGSKWGLVKIIAWHRTGAKLLYNQWSLHLLMHIHYSSLGE